jgi:hypothetical protein
MFGAVLAPILATASATPLPQPSPQAMALAHLVGVSPFYRGSRSEEEVAKTQAENLLHVTLPGRGPGCDPDVPACQAAAQRLARKAVHAFLEEQRAASEVTVAIIFDSELTVEEMREAAAYLKTTSGKSFARSMGFTIDPSSAPQALRSKLFSRLLHSAPFPLIDIAELLYEETRELPRSRVVAPPAPVRPPSIDPSLPSRTPRTPQ